MNFRPTADALESRMLLSFGGGNIDTSLPHYASNAAGLNFTSKTFHQVNDSIASVAAAIAKNPSTANTQLANYASSIPYGNTSLLPILQVDLALFQQGGRSIPTAEANTTITTIFETMLARDPSAAELAGGTRGLQAGVTVGQIVDSLAQSDEFLFDNVQATATIPDNQINFVSALYGSVLGREPDLGGLTYWLNQFNVAGQSTQQVAHAIATSPEAVSSPASLLHSPANTSVERLYQILDRNPTSAELASGVQVLETGYASVSQIADILVQSDEFLQSNVTPSSTVLDVQTDFVSSLYRGILGREVDTPGLNYWVGQLSTGALSTKQVAHAILTSSEAATSSTSVLQEAAYTQPSTKYYFGSVVPNGTITGNFAGTGSLAQIENLIQRDTLAYLSNGIGTTFNVLKSGVNYASDKLLTYNGHV